ncbi:hypothetical protein BZA05DRAFT_52793 [Tricharina praecox]|uniref:uncharacterized protein n=1 Tax=Tricharina praecox TaxID=43433 RepID=UPI00221F3DFA|nr:uncharacterized protein BZA05DRAFT_52793 [Tricharina praecox]KAI5850913.1 hypothetical protein BZA05DRAFT_52793 [Tricharina praecox]
MHVLCAVAIYGFWWHKPMDIQYPVVLRLEPDLAEKIYCSFDGSHDRRPPIFRKQTHDTYKKDTVPHVQVDSGIPNSTSRVKGMVRDGPADPVIQDHIPHRNDAKDVPTVLGAKNRTSYVEETVEDVLHVPGVPADAGIESQPAHMDTKYPERLEGNRFRTRSRRIRKQNFHHLFYYTRWFNSFLLWPPSDGDDSARGPALRNRCDTAFSLWPREIRFDSSARSNLCARSRMVLQCGSARPKMVRRKSWLVLVAFSVTYGGAHAGAWNTHMPSEVELLFRRISSVGLATGIPLGICIYRGMDELNEILRKTSLKVMENRGTESQGMERGMENQGTESRGMERRGTKSRGWKYQVLNYMRRLLLFLLFSFLALHALFILAARFFVVVESFISLRSLPKGSFDVVPWSNYWPHF